MSSRYLFLLICKKINQMDIHKIRFIRKKKKKKRETQLRQEETLRHENKTQIHKISLAKQNIENKSLNRQGEKKRPI